MAPIRVFSPSGVVERISQVNDDGQVEHITVLELKNDHQHMTLQVPSEMFGDDAALCRASTGACGEGAETVFNGRARPGDAAPAFK